MADRLGLGIALALFLTAGGSAEEPTEPALVPVLGFLVSAESVPDRFFHAVPGNVFTRTLFVTAGPSNTQIAVQDVLVPPDTLGEIAALPGPAILEVLDGQGTLSLQRQQIPLFNGEIRFTPAGRPLAITNTTSRPMLLRFSLFAFERG